MYVVYFKRQTITVKELRQNYSVINYLKVRWDYQQAHKTQITQCHNCQMFGHGSSRCQVKTFCANCAGQHKTSECEGTADKCANCNGSHKSTFDQCPSKINYLNIRQRSQPAQRRSVRQNTARQANGSYNNNYPNTLHQSIPAQSGNWISRRDAINNNSGNNTYNSGGPNELFSIEEIKNLTLELITKLKNCKSKAEQFEVITNLAVKFLS